MTEASIKQKITDAMKTAMRAREKDRLAVIRLIQAAFKQREVDNRIELDDPAALELLGKMVKQRRDSIEQYKKAQRADLAEKEDYEIQVIQEFLPQPLSAAAIEQLVSEAIQESGAGTMQDMGRVMNLLKPQLQGRADIGKVGSLVKEKLAR